MSSEKEVNEVYLIDHPGIYFFIQQFGTVVGVEVRFNNNSFLSLLKFFFFLYFLFILFSFLFFCFLIVLIFSKPIVIEEKIFANTEVLLWMIVTGAVSPIVRAQQYACDLFENNKR